MSFHRYLDCGSNNKLFLNINQFLDHDVLCNRQPFVYQLIIIITLSLPADTVHNCEFVSSMVVKCNLFSSLSLCAASQLQLINLLPHAMAPLHILCKGYLSSVLNQSSSSSGGDKQQQQQQRSNGESSHNNGTHPSRGSTSTTTNGRDSDDRMDVDMDSDSEVEILTGPPATTNGGTPKSSSSSSPTTSNGTAAGGGGGRGDLAHSSAINSNVESKLKKMAKVELQQLSGV